jgi:hypothetical protein
MGTVEKKGLVRKVPSLTGLAQGVYITIFSIERNIIILTL